VQKLTVKHVVDINVLAFTLTAEYAEQFCNVANADSIKQYTQDIVYNTRILAEFNAEHNVQKLHRDIIAQDTCVREHFVELLQYIEEHNLIARSEFACKASLV
jgi:hypothetical protein